ncbi:uncharacterized protein LOC106176012 [Lingula anatina]|uniref:Uncharacterized protein LOC106176012 n=1 Tax=Lingula anatina TaxID=7574 RepID=A0A1S3JU99_LINAN|nr:uncharacterized protein LOC106176012 [Lingula anatina]|eukprot:XP_013413671.1 uncharacterized protein LOC106176012 [Lingula anatina]
MFPLFELAKILKYGGSGNGSSRQNATVRRCAWKEVGEMSQLALYFSNDYLLLRYCIRGRAPVVRQIPWLPDQPIVDLCFDATGTWLLVITVKTHLFIIPVLTLMNPSAHVNQLWKTDDVTEIKPVLGKGGRSPTCVTWWYTLSDQHIAVVGTQQGDILCVDLLRNIVLGETSIPEGIVKIDLVQDDRQSVTYALISTRSGSQWKLLLEQKNMEIHWVEDRGVHEQMDGRPVLPIYNFVNQTVSEELSHDFIPLKFYNFGKGITLSAQYARGRHFVAAHDCKSQTYQVYDSNLEHNPLFVYKIPANTENLLLTDKLMFMTQMADGKTQLMLLSNQMSETSLDDHINFNKDAIVQAFGFPASESIVAVFKRSYPFYWHEKREEELLQKSASASSREFVKKDEKLATDANKRRSGGTSQEKPKSELEAVELSAAYSIQISTHTVLDGCIVVTQDGAYECRPRVSPERYFLDLALTTSDSHQTELLGIMLSLDINMLYELAAEYRLARGDFVHSIRLYQLSKCPYIKRVANFAHYGRIPEVMNYLKQVLGNRSLDLNTSEKKQLADMALHCYVHQIVTSNGKDKGLVQALRDFLLSSFSYDEMTALTLLSMHNLMDLLFELAKSRGLIGDALELLVQQGHVTFTTPQLDILAQKGVSIHLARVRDGTFLRCMSTEDFVNFLLEKPQLAMQFVPQLSIALSSMDLNTLLQVAQLFDPSKQVVREIMAKELDNEGWGRRKNRRSHSVSSMSSFMSSVSSMSDHSESAGDVTMPSVSELVHFFILVVLHLNEKHRQPKFSTDFLEEDMSYEAESDDLETSFSKKPRLLTLQPAAIGCGQNHSALARNGDLYTWGNTDHGRLGHGDITTPHGLSQVQRVETLHMLKIQVVSVSCGAQHTLVLSNQGLYSWGSSQYGQVGAGQRQKYTRPMLLDSVQDVQFVSVSCGQYHSMALAADGRVFTWGWGVHGNLGHGNVEDCLIPTNIQALNDKQVTRISAGYSHSVVCTARGEVYTFGCGMFGQLGHAKTEKRTFPIKVNGIPEPVHTVATKYFHNIAVTIDNQVYVWGASPQVLRYMAHLTRRQRMSATGSVHGGPQRPPDIPKHLLPQLVDTTMVFDKIVQVSCGNNHSVMITQDGEMYSWGKNYDGQLGLGSKMEQTQPTMVVSVNDKKIVHVCCGAEFAIALDSEGAVYSWGRNDTGQLGWSEHLESTSKYSNRRPKHSRDRSSGGFEREFLVPTQLKGFPSLTILSRKLLMPKTKRKHSHDSSDWWSDDCYEDVSDSLEIPNLSTVVDPPYGSQVIAVVLKHMSSFCEPTKLLRMCIDHEDCQSAADVCQSGGLYSQALYYRLRWLSQCAGQVENMCQTAARIITFYLKHVSLSSGLHQNHYQREPAKETIRQTLGHVFDFWDRQKLPVSDLESLLNSHMDQIAYPLSLMAIRENSELNEDEVSTDPKLGNIPEEIKKQFSTKFLLGLTANVVNRIEKGQGCEEYCQILSGETAGLKVEPEQNLIPIDKLWQEILQNLSKDVEKRSHITMSTNEIEYLTAARPSFLQTNEEVSSSPQPVRAVLFTCGHNFTEKMFLDTTLTQLSNDLTKGRLPLNNSAMLLSQYYKKKGYIPMACPKCVFATVQDIPVA